MTLSISQSIKTTSLSVLFLLTGSCLFGQISLDAQIIPRSELRHGYKRLPGENEEPALLVVQRTRLGLGYKYDNLQTHISFQDVRAWGHEPQRTQNPSVAIHEAWAQLNFSDAVSLKTGRQHLQYDNERFFSINDWNPAGQKHDVALFKYRNREQELHFAAAFNQQDYDNLFGTQYNINNYKYMNFLWYNTPVGENSELSLLAVTDGFQHPTITGLMYLRGTWSVFFKRESERLSFMINPAFQHGKTRSGQDIVAYYFRAEAETNLVEQFKINPGIEIFSGNDPTDADDEKFRAFDPLYGVGHGYNGAMDYFTNIPAHTRNAGLINPFLKTRYKLSDNYTLNTDLHLFFIHGEFIDQGESISKYLGTEADISLTYRFNSFTDISCGFSWMFATPSMEVIRGGSSREPAYWAFLMLKVKPQLM